MECVRKHIMRLVISKISKGINYCTFWMSYILLQYLPFTNSLKKSTPARLFTDQSRKHKDEFHMTLDAPGA